VEAPPNIAPASVAMRSTALTLLMTTAGALQLATRTASSLGTTLTAERTAECTAERTAESVKRPADVPATLLWPTPTHMGPPGRPSEFELNQGRVIDTLRYDYPRLFVDKPDLSIFREDVELRDESGGVRLRGKRAYSKVFDMLRFLRRTGMSDAEVTYHIFVNDATIRMRWSAKLKLRDPAFGMQRLDILDGVSVYELDSDGLVRSHTLEYIVPRGLEHLMPLSLANVWPITGSPELAIPCFRTPELTFNSFLQTQTQTQTQTQSLPLPLPLPPPSQLPLRAQTHHQRMSVPCANAASGETPAQRAARERAEDADKARLLAEVNALEQERGRLGNAFGVQLPQACETSYDCDSPMVCCDLIFASVCCTGGLMIPVRPTFPVMQPRAIPIPVEKDSPQEVPPQYPNVGF